VIGWIRRKHPGPLGSSYGGATSATDGASIRTASPSSTPGRYRFTRYATGVRRITTPWGRMEDGHGRIARRARGEPDAGGKLHVRFGERAEETDHQETLAPAPRSDSTTWRARLSSNELHSTIRRAVSAPAPRLLDGTTDSPQADREHCSLTSARAWGSPREGEGPCLTCPGLPSPSVMRLAPPVTALTAGRQMITALLVGNPECHSRTTLAVQATAEVEHD